MFGRYFLVTGVLFILLFCRWTSAQSHNAALPEDSLTSALCNNLEQIVSKRVGDFQIQYFMGETQLNMKTMTGFLSLNSASIPYYRQFQARRFGGLGMILGGIGLIVADGFIHQPKFPVISIGGVATAIWGLTVFVGANDKFRLAIYHYNRDICKIK